MGSHVHKQPLYEPEIWQALNVLRTEAKGLYLSESVDEIYEVPEPFEFYKNWVSPNVPVLIKGAVSHWPAITKWTVKYFKQKFGSKMVTVALTPNGYADAVNKVDDTEYFVMPDEKLMTVTEFFDKLYPDNEEEIGNKSVYYIQKQNSNLTVEFPELSDDVDFNLTWASRTFQKVPDAVNLWIGDGQAVSSLHKDPYENIYCVVSGYKDFTLLPPTDRPWIPYKLLPQAKYTQDKNGSYTIKPLREMESVPWICIDPLNPDVVKYPLYKQTSPVTVRVFPGDALYLPSLWFHHVQQSHGCIAVNYWYDMEYDIKYSYFRLLESLSQPKIF